MLRLDEKALKALHSRANLRRFLENVAHGQVDKITKACSKGLDPNFHCSETGGKLIYRMCKILVGFFYKILPEFFCSSKVL